MDDPWPAQLERGLAGAPIAGEARSGDLAVFVPTAAGGLAALIDGLGHGAAAADAAELAAAVVREHAEDPPQRLLERCHAGLRRTRGVVMTVVWFDVARALLCWTGVGNVEARLLRAAGGNGESALVFAGVLGYRLPGVRPGTVRLAPGDAVVLATDGIEPSFSPALVAGMSAQALAERILARHGRSTDDALAVVVRFRP